MQRCKTIREYLSSIFYRLFPMNNGFGPLLVERKNRAVYCGSVIIAVSSITLFGYLTYLAEKEHHGVTMYLLCMSIVAMFLGEVLRRCCLLAEEVYHMQERYAGKWKKIIWTVFSFQSSLINDTGMLVFVGFFSYFAYHFYSENKEEISKEGGRYYIFLFQNIAIVPIIGYLAGIKAPSEVEKSEMNERYNKNLADGLAWGYYFGYLKLVLPRLEQVQRSSQELRENLNPVKLFILLPNNCYCYDSLDKCDDRIQPFMNSTPYRVNRGGIQKRQYHHSVYKITISAPENDQATEEGKYAGEYYCMMEYASTLLTLYDMSMNKTAGLSEEDRLSQVKIFYNKLKKILDEDPECRGKYQLVPLGDAHDNLALTIVKSIRNSPVDVS